VGVFWGALFGLVFFRTYRWRKFSAIYGAGFGLGMCAPTINELRKAFVGHSKSENEVVLSEEAFLNELESVKDEIMLRDKLRL